MNTIKKMFLLLFNLGITGVILLASVFLFNFINISFSGNLFLSIPTTLGALFFGLVIFLGLIGSYSQKSVLEKLTSESSSNYIFLLNLKNTFDNELKSFQERIDCMEKKEITPLDIEKDSKNIHNIAYVVGLYKEVLEEIERIYKKNIGGLEKKEILYEESVFGLSNSYSLAKYESFLEKEKEDFVGKIKKFNLLLDLWMKKHKEQLVQVEENIQKMQDENGLSSQYKNAIDLSQFRFQNYIKQIKDIG